MNNSIRDLFAEIYDRINLPASAVGTMLSQGALLRFMNRAWQSMADDAQSMAPGVLKTRIDIDLIQDVPVQMPANLVNVLAIRLGDRELQPFSQRPAFASQSQPCYEIYARSIILRNGQNATYMLYYEKHPPDLHYGLCPAAAPQSAPSNWPADAPAFSPSRMMYLASPSGATHSDPNATTFAGKVSASDGDYAGLKIVTDGGTGTNQEVFITQSVGGANPYVVVDPPFSVQPDATTTYAIMPMWEDCVNDCLVCRTIARLPQQAWAELANTGAAQQAEERFSDWCIGKMKDGRDAGRDLDYAMSERREDYGNPDLN